MSCNLGTNTYFVSCSIPHRSKNSREMEAPHRLSFPAQTGGFHYSWSKSETSTHTHTHSGRHAHTGLRGTPHVYAAFSEKSQWDQRRRSSGQDLEQGLPPWTQFKSISEIPRRLFFQFFGYKSHCCITFFRKLQKRSVIMLQGQKKKTDRALVLSET